MKEETLNIICGELSTKNFSNQHPEVAKEWFIKALEKLDLLEFLVLNDLIIDLEKLTNPDKEKKEIQYGQKYKLTKAGEKKDEAKST